ncbi:MAG: oxygen-independent coproporphyrinogen III oxidase [Planctomycetota bacterium]|jgi:oxygen-independent coproporphyrinogen-3 oxidase
MNLSELLKKYDRPGPRYTSYPTAREFHDGVDDGAYAAQLDKAAQEHDAPLALYLHLPFCDERCLFCGCNVVISKGREPLGRYMGALLKELDMVAAHLGGRQRVEQYHWGGGTPTYLTPDEMRLVHGKVAEHFDIASDAEAAIEVDPRVTTKEHLGVLHELGFNRISMGVQDFTPAVQEAINRVQSYEQTASLIEEARRLGFVSTNIDLIYGLPHQTPETFAESLALVNSIRPERLAVYSFAMVPWMKGHQRKIDEDTLPGPETKLQVFLEARQAFLDAGYLSVGMDHFALPEDDMGRALQDGTLWRNFMGYTVQQAPDMVAVGMSGIGDVAGAYVQNNPKLVDYERAIEDGHLATQRGYVLTDDDKLRRHVITALMCAFHVEVSDVEHRFGVDFWEVFADARGPLQEMADDGLVEFDAAGVSIVGDGRLLVRNACMAFDAHQRSGEREFSRTV